MEYFLGLLDDCSHATQPHYCTHRFNFERLPVLLKEEERPCTLWESLEQEDIEKKSLENIVNDHFLYKHRKNGDNKELYESIDGLIEAAFSEEDMYHKTSEEYIPKFKKNVVEQEYNAFKEYLTKSNMDIFIWQDEDGIDTYAFLRTDFEPQKLFFLSFTYATAYGD